MSLEVLTTDTLPVTLAEVKAYLRIDSNDEDAVLSALIDAAVDHVQEETGQQIAPATLSLTLDAFPRGREIRLPRPPLRDVTAVSYFDASGLQKTVSFFSYTTDTAARPGRIVLKPGHSWPATDGRAAAVTVEFEAGPTTDKPLSPSLRQALMFLIGHWYEHREGVTDRTFTEVPLTVQAVLNRHTFHEVV